MRSVQVDLAGAENVLHPALRDWFKQRFARVSDIQQLAWPVLLADENALLSAPTGSGKTLAAFLAAVNRLLLEHRSGQLEDTTSVLYISPLRALASDIQRNLQQPLDEISAQLGEPLPIRVQVRTGDTPQSERARMRRTAPHILVTTPESAYILLTSQAGRQMLAGVRTVIVDEIHALADDKRGAHLSLSLRRLERLTGARRLQYIGVSATQKPLQETARLLCSGAPCRIIVSPGRKQLDLALHVPDTPLTAVMPNEVWLRLYRQIAEWVQAHRTTLVFVGTRRLAERASRQLAELLGTEAVATHHGSLAREVRQRTEQRLKAGDLKCLVATASLELGIDIGSVDLVVQIGSPRSICTMLQRTGRSGHGLDDTPKARLLPLSPNDLAESVALLQALRDGELDALGRCPAALDVLGQQIVAEVACGEIGMDELFDLVRGSWAYRELPRERFDAVVDMLAGGYARTAGAPRALIHRDDASGALRGHRSARLTALTCGGTIPEHFDYEVVMLPSGLRIGTLNEDFAFESVPGDIVQLGNVSYRFLRVEQGKIYVEDAGGAPANLPFWVTEGHGRSREVSEAVSDLRRCIGDWLGECSAAEAVQRAVERWSLDAAAAEQLVGHLDQARSVLGVLPGHRDIVLERFLDPLGDMHLVLHSTWGARVNRAWGLALRKKFCRRFNFELQAAALEDALMLSLSAVHSFALDEVVHYLNSATLLDTLTQAVLDTPLFATRWRWCASNALAVKRFWSGRRAPPWFQRNDAENLIAQVFPDQLACAENLSGARDVPDHPLVRQTLDDCLGDSMDGDGLLGVQQGIEAGRIRVHCVDLTAPSPLAEEIINARPYAFLDDAPLEERRTLALQGRRPAGSAEGFDGRIDPDAARRICAALWTGVRSPDELYDFISQSGAVAAADVVARGGAGWIGALVRERRCVAVQPGGTELLINIQTAHLAAALGWKGAEGLKSLHEAPERAEALRQMAGAHLSTCGPIRSDQLAARLGVAGHEADAALAVLEGAGEIIRGDFGESEQWCNRTLLMRIQRASILHRRAQSRPVSPQQFWAFARTWQHLGAERRAGPAALHDTLVQLQGHEAALQEWHEILRLRIEDYTPGMLDQLLQSGQIAWLRTHPPVRLRQTNSPMLLRRTALALLPRSELPMWRNEPAEQQLSSRAAALLDVLQSRGARFYNDLRRDCDMLGEELDMGLRELIGCGLISSDSLAGLESLHRSVRPASRTRRRMRSAPWQLPAGRWWAAE
ncbi:MAG: DEAD/DEAH box helicase, partial [Gammaproteobacteria bacterium AqS3]|nr:DEAD/DEAH box helicase [Gammaproteobacteria bacterium AqS3]